MHINFPFLTDNKRKSLFSHFTIIYKKYIQIHLLNAGKAISNSMTYKSMQKIPFSCSIKFHIQIYTQICNIFIIIIEMRMSTFHSHNPQTLILVDTFIDFIVVIKCK